MGWNDAVVLLGLGGALACGSSAGPDETDTYERVLRALDDSLDGEVVFVQTRAVRVGGGISAPGLEETDFLPAQSTALEEAVERVSGRFVACPELGRSCLTGPSGNALALSAIEPEIGAAAVWVTYGRLRPPEGPGSWEIIYYRVPLRLEGGVWEAEAPVLLGSEP